MRLFPQRWTWAPGDPEISKRLSEIFESWRGTRYVEGQCVKGAGANCLGSGHGVLCELYGREFPKFPRLPADTALHDKRGAMEAMHKMRRLFPKHRAVRDGIARPGMIFITGPAGGGPGHWRFVGPRKNTIWEMGMFQFQESGFAFCPRTQRIFRVYELLEIPICLI